MGQCLAQSTIGLILSILLSSGRTLEELYVRCSVVNCTLGHLALHWEKSYDSWNHIQMEMGWGTCEAKGLLR